MRAKKKPGPLATAGALKVVHVNTPLLPANRPLKQVAITLRGDDNAIIGLALFASAADARAFLLTGRGRA